MVSELRTNQEGDEFPYKIVANEINNFVYPPIRPVPGLRTAPMEAYLPLDRPMLHARPFAIYVSIPYCRVKCHSCHCFKGLLPRDHGILDDYVEALLSQARGYAAAPRFVSSRCESIYVGGGTASVLTPAQAERLIDGLREAFRLDPDAEINFEGNPDDFTRDYLRELKGLGVARVSIGYQSSRQEILDALNSPHNANESLRSVEDALATGFRTINVDLLYNVPGQTAETWRADLRTLTDLAPQGISAGDYVVFPESNAEHLISTGRLQPQHDLATTYEWYLETTEILAAHAYTEQVRGIFAQRGHFQRYVDLCCPEACDILGLGAGALSFIDRYQFRNPFDPTHYVAGVREGRLFEAEAVSRPATQRDLMERFVMHNFFAARLSRRNFRGRFDCDPVVAFPAIFARLEKHRLVTIDDDEIKLTDLGRKWRRNIYHEFRTSDEQFVVTHA